MEIRDIIASRQAAAGGCVDDARLGVIAVDAFGRMTFGKDYSKLYVFETPANDALKSCYPREKWRRNITGRKSRDLNNVAPNRSKSGIGNGIVNHILQARHARDDTIRGARAGVEQIDRVVIADKQLAHRKTGGPCACREEREDGSDKDPDGCSNDLFHNNSVRVRVLFPAALIAPLTAGVVSGMPQ